MNVLFVTYDFPYPTNSGGKNRAFHLIKHTAHAANIFLFSFVREEYNPENNEELHKIHVNSIKVHKRRKLTSPINIPRTLIGRCSIFKTLYYEKKALEKIVQIIKEKKIDVVHFESSYTGYYIGPELKKLGVKVVLGTENIEYQLYYDYAKSLKKAYLKPFIYYQAKRLKEEELGMVKMADAVTTITKSEAKILEEETGKSCEIVANGIEPELYKFEVNKALTNNLLFVGNFDYFPNVDAIDFFCENVFKKLNNTLTLTIVGKNVNQKVKFYDKRIIKKDFVDDIIAEYRNSDILVFPIRIGGGTNFKVLEAMSLGLPIVAQPERLAGLKAVSGEHFLEANSAEEYTMQINALYDDRELGKTIARKARTLIEENYGWDKIGEKLLKVWSNTL